MINFLGDVYLDKAYKLNIELNNIIFNLEYPISSKGAPLKDKVILHQNKSFIKETFNCNPLAVCLANNHIMDYGEVAFQDTLKFLRSNNINYFGAGNRMNNFNNPCIINLEDKKIGLLGYCCPSTNPIIGDEKNNGSAPLDVSLILRDIKKIKNTVDYIVLQLHWGDEDIKYPKPSDVKKARNFIEAGVDLIIGHHAHVIQTKEKYKGKYIYYGLGNFIFPDLKLDSYFDGAKYQKKYIKKQRKNNRRSLVVNIDDNLNCSDKAVEFKNKIIDFKNINISDKVILNERKYKKYCIYSKRKDMIISFIESPKIPTIKQMKYFLSRE